MMGKDDIIYNIAEAIVFVDLEKKPLHELVGLRNYINKIIKRKANRVRK